MLRICLIIVFLCQVLFLLAQDKPGLPIPQLLELAKNSATDTGRMDHQLQAAYAFVLKPGEDTVDLDSALLLIDQINTTNRRINDLRVQALCYLGYSHAWWELNRHELAKKYALLAVDAFSRLHDPLNLAYSYVQAAGCYDYLDLHEGPERIRLYRLAIPLFDSVGRKEMQASTLELLGDCLASLSDTYAALPILLQALKVYKAIGHNELGNLYSLLGSVYSANGDARNAIVCGLLAVQYEEHKPGQGLGLCTAYNRMGIIYYDFLDYRNAEESFDNALKIAMRFGNIGYIRSIAVNIVNTKIGQGKLFSALQTLRTVSTRYPAGNRAQYIPYAASYIKVYSYMERWDSAKRYADRFIAIYDSLASDDHLHTCIDPVLITYMMSIRQYDLAKRYALHFSDYCLKNSLLTGLFRNYYELFKMDSATSDLKTAIVDYQKYINLKDSLQNVANGKQIAALKLDYETEKKDKDIAVLTREQALSRSALHQAGLVRNAVISGSVMLMILLGLSYNRYRIKRRSNFLLQLQKQAIDQKNLELHQLNISQGKLLKEKEWLLKEIHHRVKNNLQIAMSLLNTQTYYLDNEKAVAAIRQSRNRMFAMSLIHQRLYQSDNLELIYMNRYIPELINYIEDSFAGDRNIRFRIRIDPVQLDVAQAVPIGLIVNEAVTNSIKYAFPARDGGTIDILLKYIEENNILLQLTDDGIGLRPDFDIKQARSMGMQLIDTFNQQLEGTMTIENRSGLVISIVLKKFA